MPTIIEHNASQETAADALALMPAAVQIVNVDGANAGRIDRLDVLAEFARQWLALVKAENANTGRQYSTSLFSPHAEVPGFFVWAASAGAEYLSKALVMAYKAKLSAAGKAPSTINSRMVALRKMASEAIDHHIVAQGTMDAIGRVKRARGRGHRSGHWLSAEQATALVNAPDKTTLHGLRDRAILAVAVGSGLRRAELAGLSVDQMIMANGRWELANILGKRDKYRDVPIARWVADAVREWLDAAAITTGRVFRPIDRWGNIGKTMTPQTIYDVVREWVATVPDARSSKSAPHDLRRTFAQLSHRAGAPIEQISLSLGHSSIVTTQRYLGLGQDKEHAPADYWSIVLS